MGLSYIRALESAGGIPLLIPLIESDDGLRAIYDRLDGLFLAGGGDVDPVRYHEKAHPKLGEVDAARDRVELLLTRWALEDQMPILAVCRGIQVLNVAAGGTLYQDIAAQVEDAIKHRYYPGYPRDLIAHPVIIEPDCRLAAIMGSTQVGTNSLHHQAVKDVASGFIACARTADGLVEGIESANDNFALGVQWHPEALTEADPRMRRLFEAFVKEATGG